MNSRLIKGLWIALTAFTLLASGCSQVEKGAAFDEEVHGPSFKAAVIDFEEAAP